MIKTFALSLLFSLGTIFSQTTATLSQSGPSSVYPGATVNLNLNLLGSSGQNIAGLQWTNSLLPGASITVASGSASTTATKGLYCTTTWIMCLEVGFVGTTVSNNVYADGVFATISMTVPTTAAAGVQLLSLTNLVAASTSASAVPLTFPAPLPLTILSMCDLNGDGAVNAADVAISINEATGVTTCADNLGNIGGCNAIFVERIVTAAVGGNCKTGL